MEKKSTYVSRKRKPGPEQFPDAMEKVLIVMRWLSVDQEAYIEGNSTEDILQGLFEKIGIPQLDLKKTDGNKAIKGDKINLNINEYLDIEKLHELSQITTEQYFMLQFISKMQTDKEFKKAMFDLLSDPKNLSILINELKNKLEPNNENSEAEIN